MSDGVGLLLPSSSHSTVTKKSFRIWFIANDAVYHFGQAKVRSRYLNFCG
jgi:hypothetical protein